MVNSCHNGCGKQTKHDKTLTFVTRDGQFMSQWVRKTDATRRKHDLRDTKRSIHVTMGAKNLRNTTKT